jgi:hypothetical protein
VPATLIDVERTGIREQECLGLHDGVELLENLLLDIHALEHGFDDGIAIGDLLIGLDGRDQSHALVHLGLRERATLDRGRVVVANAAHPTFQDLLGGVEQLHGQARIRQAHGDAAAHGASADHGHRLDFG